MECDGEHMKKYRGKTATKIVVFLLTLIFACITLGGGFFSAVCMYMGYYQGESQAEVKKYFFERAYETDALTALEAGEENDYNRNGFTNYEFAILEGGSWSEKELKNEKNYLVSNFSNGFPENYSIKKYNVGEKSDFDIATSYFGSSYVTHGYETVEKKVESFAEEYNTVYAYIDGAYYPINSYYEDVGEGDSEHLIYTIGGVDFEETELLPFDGETFPIGEGEVQSVTVSPDKSSAKATVVVSDPTEKTYTVISSSAANIVEGNDFLYEAQEFYNYSKILSVLGPIGFFGGGVLTLIFFVMLMCLSGYHLKEKETTFELYGGKQVGEHLYLQRRGLDRIPLDVNVILYISIIASVICFASELISALQWNNVVLVGLGLSSLTLGGGIVTLLYSMTVASNFKCPAWWRNSLVYMCLHLIKKWTGGLAQSFRKSAKSVKMHTRIWVLYGILAFVELVVLSGASSYMSSDGFGILISFWFIEKVLFAFLLIKLLRQFAEIKAATKEITEGNLSASVNTEKMFIDLQEEGEYINSIKNGLDVAIEERMKSERFQTELITNVSHDIKTPLTSIISYVDLLGKEDLKNDKAKEYLEVLQRQSQRLKKLLQDLLDASKASTGNVELHMEKVDAGVLLNQTLGEFEEKLQKSGVELKVKMPSTSPSIYADSRYLWRVFDNLMNNICKYGASGTRAYINLEVKDAKVILTFLNTSKEELNISTEELMQRFVRGDSSRNTEGSGLGLSIAQSLTELMGGEMRLSVEGDLFKVELSFPSC